MKKYISVLSLIGKVLLYVGIFLVFFIVFNKKIISFFSQNDTKKAQKKLENKYPDTDLSIPITKLKIIADDSYKAMKGWGTDEDTLFKVLEGLNKTDLIRLFTEFGIKEEKDLFDWYREELSDLPFQKDLTKMQNIWILTADELGII